MKKETTFISTIFLHKYFWKSPFVELLQREHERDANASEKLRIKLREGNQKLRQISM